MLPSKKAFAYFSSHHHDLDSLCVKVKEWQTLNQKLSTYLDSHLATYCQLGHLIGDRLIILVANGSIATQLRFRSTDLLAQFTRDPAFKHIRHIDYKVRPVYPMSSSLQQKRKITLLSTATAELIRNLAETIEDKTLREVMERIATRTCLADNEK